MCLVCDCCDGAAGDVAGLLPHGGVHFGAVRLGDVTANAWSTATRTTAWTTTVTTGCASYNEIQQIVSNTCNL